MKKLFFTGALIISNLLTTTAQPIIIGEAIASDVAFLEKQPLTAKENILRLFDKYDIVIFCERTHDEFTQYELLTDLFADSRFYNQVGDIFMEMGGSNYDTEINDYMLSKNLSQKQSNERALQIQRNATWYPLWERYNYHFLLTSLY